MWNSRELQQHFNDSQASLRLLALLFTRRLLERYPSLAGLVVWVPMLVGDDLETAAGERPPPPVFWMHQLSAEGAPGANRLDEARFAAKVEKWLRAVPPS